jgi:hypothetical protein
VLFTSVDLNQTYIYVLVFASTRRECLVLEDYPPVYSPASSHSGSNVIRLAPESERHFSGTIFNDMLARSNIVGYDLFFERMPMMVEIRLAREHERELFVDGEIFC